MNSGTYSKHINLRGTPCPVNFVRCRLTLETLNPADSLLVDLDKGEPEEMVISGLKKDGYQVEIIHSENDWLRLKVVISD